MRCSAITRHISHFHTHIVGLISTGHTVTSQVVQCSTHLFPCCALRWLLLSSEIRAPWAYYTRRLPQSQDFLQKFPEVGLSQSGYSETRGALRPSVFRGWFLSCVLSAEMVSAPHVEGVNLPLLTAPGPVLFGLERSTKVNN